MGIAGIKEYFKNINTNHEKIAKENFEFLLSRGYKFTNPKNSYICFGLLYQKDELIIQISYDYREHYLDVGLRRINYPINILNIYMDILNTDISTPQKREDLKKSVENARLNSNDFKFGLRKDDYILMVKLYADFVRENLEQIESWKPMIISNDTN